MVLNMPFVSTDFYPDLSTRPNEAPPSTPSTPLHRPSGFFMTQLLIAVEFGPLTASEAPDPSDTVQT